MNVWALVISVVLLAANGFFVGAEFALIAARRTRMEQLAEEGRVLARVALRSMRELTLMLSGAQLGITMASLGLGFVAEPAVASGLEALLSGVVDLPPRALHTVAVVIALTVVVFLHMVLGEMVPKNIVIAEPERSALALAVPIRLYTAVFRPVIHALNATANAGLRLIGVRPRDELLVAHSADELAAMLGESREEGLIEEFEHELLSGALRFRNRTAGAVMVPQADVTGIPVTASIARVERVALGTGHSRLPVYGEDEHDVLGFLHVKDLLKLAARDHDRPIPDELIRPMLRVGTSASLDQVLVRMRFDQTHFAVVVDRPGRVAGIITLEDVLEQLVGDIRDEHDVQAATRKRRRPVRRRRR